MAESDRMVASRAFTGVRGWASTALLIVAIAYQIFENVRADTFYLTPDKMHHVISAQAFLQGFGMSHVFADPANLAAAVVEPHTLWAGGYSLLLAGLLGVTGELYLTLTLADFFSTVVFFAAWWLITAELEPLTGSVGRVFILGWWTFVHSPLSSATLEASGSSDLLAIALFSAGIWFAIRMIRGRAALINAALSGVCMGAAAGVRYAYWPLIVVFPLGWIAMSRRKNFQALPPALLQLAVSAGFVLCVMLLQPAGAERTQYDQLEWGFQLDQLSNFFPFPANALGLFPALRSAGGHLGIDLLAWNTTVPYLWLISAAVIAVAVREAALFLGGYWRLASPAAEEKAAALVLAISGAAMAITLAMLVYLTVRAPTGLGATYGKVPRYYMPAEIFLFLGIAPLFDRAWNRARRSPNKLAMAALTGGIAVMAAGPLAHRAGRIQAMAAGVHETTEYTAAVRAMQSTITELRSRGLPVVYIDTDHERVLLAGMAGAWMMNLDRPAELPLLDRRGATVVAGLARAGRNATSEMLAASLRQQGARTEPATGAFDLLILDAPGSGPN